ncbi:MAG: plastocyanin/azurin family copper-binding protein [Verrucomicrobiales bacterium]|nr:plastocyanin/azurin family copper-binding protein [Verrucomicrobiales bacterium]
MKSILTATLGLCLLAVSLGAKAEEMEITITADKVQFLYDIKEFTVKPGTKVKLKLVNPADSVTRQPHNLLIVKPSKKDVVGMAANAGMADPEFLTTKQAVPDSEDILFHSKLIQAGEEDILEFVAPSELGDYPYLCTYPGHWAIMNGVMKVAE